jgi:uncharacterized RDD family membrane protein YckC
MPTSDRLSSDSNTNAPQLNRLPVAGVDRRIMAKVIDTFLAGCTLIPMFVFFIYDILQAPDPPQPGMISWIGVGVSVLLALAFTAYQIFLLAVRSQTVGKRWLRIQIANYQTGEPASIMESLVLRSVASGLITFIPLIGWIYVFADSLFIFRSDRRCIHDLIAGTNVVELPS